MNKSSLFIILSILILLFSCRTYKKDIKEPIKDKKEKGPGFLFSKLKENELKYDWFVARFDAEVILDKNPNNFKGQIRIKKDSLIWISISPLLGIEMLRVLLSNDSVYIMNRINRSYFVGDYDYINLMMNTAFDYDMIQALLIGNDFSYYQNSIFKSVLDNKQYKLTTLSRKKLKEHARNQNDKERILIQDIWLDPENFKIVRESIKEIKKGNNKLNVEYLKFEEINGMLFSVENTYEVIAENKIFIRLQYSKIRIDDEVSLSFTIPASYKPMEEKNDEK
jgi:hypothetical protein